MANPRSKAQFSFDRAIRVIARERRWTIKKVAWFVGVSTSTLRQCMASEHTYITTVERYAQIFGMSVPEFYEKGLRQYAQPDTMTAR